MSTSADIQDFHKQPSEKLVIYGDFSNNLADGEYIITPEVSVVRNDGEAETGVTTSPQVAGDDNERVATIVYGGDPDYSPYQITFKGTTNLGYVWEIDVLMRVLEV